MSNFNFLIDSNYGHFIAAMYCPNFSPYMISRETEPKFNGKNNEYLIKATRIKHELSTKEYCKQFKEINEIKLYDFSPVKFNLKDIPETTYGLNHVFDEPSIHYLKRVDLLTTPFKSLTICKYWEIDFENLNQPINCNIILNNIVYHYYHLCYIIRRCFEYFIDFHNNRNLEDINSINNKIVRFNQLMNIFKKIKWHAICNNIEEFNKLIKEEFGDVLETTNNQIFNVYNTYLEFIEFYKEIKERIIQIPKNEYTNIILNIYRDNTHEKI